MVKETQEDKSCRRWWRGAEIITMAEWESPECLKWD